MADQVINEDVLAKETNDLRKQVDQSVSFMQKLFAAIQQLKGEKEKLEQELLEEKRKLAEEIEKRKEAEENIRQLEKHIEEIKNEFARKVQQLQAINDELSSTIEELEKNVIEKDDSLKKTIAEKDQIIARLHHEVSTQELLMKGLKFMRQNVDAFRCGQGTLKEPCGACMLPNNFVLVADTLEGLLLFSAHTELIRQVTSEIWKWPQGLVYDSDNGIIMVSMVKKFGEGAEGWHRVITTFNTDLDELSCIDGPPDAIIKDNVAKERLAMGPHGELYLTLADSTGSALYAYVSREWFLLTKRQGATFTDCQVLAVIPPITEVLVVESRMGYLHKFSIRGPDIADRKSVAAVEKPGAICVDNKGQLFVHDVSTGKVRQVHNITFDPIRDVCIVDDHVFSITASHGYLGVAVKHSKLVKIFRYE